MNDSPDLGGGRSTANSLNFNVAEAAAFEPSDEQLAQFRTDLQSIADGVRPHLTDGFTVTTRLAATQSGPQGVVVVSFPTGEAIGPSLPVSAAMFDGEDDPDWAGPIPEEEIDTMSRRITSMAVAHWASMLGAAGTDVNLPAK